MHAPRQSDGFHLQRISGKSTIAATWHLFRTHYWQCLGLFLIIHFPFRVLVHFIVSTDWHTSPLVRGGSMLLVLLVSWTLTEGAILALLVNRRRGRSITFRSALQESLSQVSAFSCRTGDLPGRRRRRQRVPGGSGHRRGVPVDAARLVDLRRADAGPLSSLKGSFTLMRRRVGRTLWASVPALIVTIGLACAGCCLRRGNLAHRLTAHAGIQNCPSVHDHHGERDADVHGFDRCALRFLPGAGIR